MARRRFQKGYVYLKGDRWYGRYYDDKIQADGSVIRHRRNEVLGTTKEYPTKRLAERRMQQVLGRINARGDAMPKMTSTFTQAAYRCEKPLKRQSAP